MSTRNEAERVSQLIFYGFVLLVAWMAWQIVQPFMVQIAWAVLLAICVEPARTRLEPRLGPTRTAALMTALVFVLFVVPVVLVSMTLVHQGGPAVDYVQAQLRERGGASGSFHQVWEWLRARLTFLPTTEEVAAELASGIGSAAKFAAGQAGGILKGVLGFLFSLGLTLGILFFLVRDAAAFAGAVRRVLPFGAEQNERLLSLASELVTASVTATLAIAAIQGVLGALTFWMLGIGGAALWGSMMAMLALLPLIGAALIWAPAAIWLALSGSLGKGVILAAIGVLILGNVDNVIRPLLLSGKAQMNTLVLIISLMGGVSAFGFIGVVLGPLVAAVLTALFESYQATPPLATPAAPPPAPPAE